MDQATSSWCNPTPGGTAQSHTYSPFPCVSPSNAHQHPSFPRLTRISTASACILSPFKGFTFKQNEKTNKNPKHFAVNDGEGLKDGGGLKNTPSCFFFFFLNIYLFIYLFMAVLGLRFCARAFSSCGKWGPLFIAVRGPLIIAASLVAGHRLQTRRLSNCGSRA